MAISVWTAAAVVAASAAILSAATRPHDLSSSAPDAQRQKIQNSYGRLPLQFEANHGQTDAKVEFLSRGTGYSLFLTSTEAVLSLKADDHHDAVLRTKLVGGNRRPEVSGEHQLSGTANYFIGNDPSQWRTSVATYGKVRYRGVYPGIDLVYYGNQRQLEYDFVVAPGARPEAIQMEFRGADKIRVDKRGDLVLEMAGREIREHKPVVYQEIGGERKPVEGRYVLAGQKRAGFAVGPYDTTKPLVVDPTLVYSTYIGGLLDDEGNGIAVDAAGNAYVTGKTASTDYPTTAGAFQTANAGGFSDVFVTKLNPSGTALVYSTYIGGSDDDEGNGIAVDKAGNAYVTGLTSSTDYPTTAGAFQTSGSNDAFVTKLNPSGTALVYSTYLGGTAYDQGNGIVVDAAGNAYVTGYTFSSDYPTTGGAFQTASAGFQEVFVTKLNPSGAGLVYSTYLGGGNDDEGNGIAIDTAGNAYVTGFTASGNYPTTVGAFQTVIAGSYDVFVSKLNASGSALVYSTYLGGGNFEQGSGIAVDTTGSAYVTGFTFSTNYPTTAGAFQTAIAGTADAFVTKLNPSGGALVYSTYLGGSGLDHGNGIAVDMAGNAYVTGFTGSADFPTTASAFQPTYATSDDVFVTELNPSGAALVYSTFLGGSDHEQGNGIALDPAGNAYVAGYTESIDYPATAGAFQTQNAGTPDVIVAKFALGARDLLQIEYVPNLGAGQAVIDVTNAGSTEGAGALPDYLCVNVYTFAQDQQLISCCTCNLSPNDLQTLSVQNDLINNTLTPGVPTGVTVALLASDNTAGANGSCNAATVTPAKLASGMRAWGTTLHAAPGGGFALTEKEFSKVAISPSELAKMTSYCGFIQANGSHFGICNSCTQGAQGAKKQ